MTGDLIQITKGPQGPAGAPGAPGAVWSPRNGRKTPRLGAMPVFHPGSLGKILLQFEHMQHIFQVGNQSGYLHLVALDAFRCCVTLFLIIITPWCFQFFTSHQSSSSHWSFDVQDGERGKRGPPGVQAELVDNLTDETDESDENSTNTCRPYRLRSETLFFQATCNFDVRLPLKKESGTNHDFMIYQKRTETNNNVP